MDCQLDKWASDRCQDSQAVKEAPSIILAIRDIKMAMDNCGDYAWRDGCRSSSSTSSSSSSESSSSSSSSSSQSYRYTYTLATSCDSGSGTDGAVQVKVTDSK